MVTKGIYFQTGILNCVPAILSFQRYIDYLNNTPFRIIISSINTDYTKITLRSE